MSETAGEPVLCECGKILAHRHSTPANLLVHNTIHSVSVTVTPTCISFRGRCRKCSKLHTITYEIQPAIVKPKTRRAPIMLGQLSLF